MIAIRKFQAGDLRALYAIALQTGDAGQDASSLYEDPDLIGHIYAAPYALLKPDLAIVAADETGVAGYVVGAIDSDAWFDRLELEWWPDLRRRYRDPGATPLRTWSADQFRAFMIHHPHHSPAEVVTAFPTHIHLNLLPRLQGQGVGARLLAAWFEAAQERGVGPAHVGVHHANARGLRFWAAQGFERLDIPREVGGRTVWMGRPAGVQAP
ncbi:MAG TPA: GNAT family N-acetyltransferase [Caulobacteraceae bacterium]|nr:GNAT family N-acetyltransferase [Caulobacteraceae bacterium]